MGDWVTARLDGVVYLEKSPVIYWMMAVSFAVFGVHDWAARLPLAVAAVLLCWLTYRIGRWAFSDQYYAFSSVFFYSNRQALLLNGRVNNLEFGSYAPGAPEVFLNDEKFRGLWTRPERRYLCVEGHSVSRIESLVGREWLFVAAESGNKFLFTNRP